MNFIKKTFGVICLTFLLNGCIEIPFETSQGEGNYSDHIATANIDGTGRFDIMERGYALFVTDPNDITQEKLLLIQDKLYLMDLDGTNKTLLLDIDIEKNLGFNNSRNKLLYMLNDDLILYDFRSGNQIHIAEDIDVSLVDANFDNTDCQVIYAVNKSRDYSVINSFNINSGETNELLRINVSSIEATNINLRNIFKIDDILLYKQGTGFVDKSGDYYSLSEAMILHLNTGISEKITESTSISQVNVDYSTGNIILNESDVYLTNISDIEHKTLLPLVTSQSGLGYNVGMFEEYIYLRKQVFNIETQEMNLVPLRVIDINKSKTNIIGIADSPAEEE